MSGKQIKYAPKQPRYDLIEMEEATLKQILESGAVIKSSQVDPSGVLCTESSTFKLKLSETSNILMVVSNRAEEAEILCTKNVFVEVTTCKPKQRQVI